MAVYCGIDWAEGHHDIAVVDDDGRLVAKRRIEETPAGVAELIGDAGRGRRRPGGAGPGRDRDTARVCWWRRCGRPVGRSIRSTRWRWPGIGNAPRCRARRVIMWTRWRWRTFCAPTGTCIGCCPTTARRPGRSACWPAATRTRCGGAPSWCRSCGRGCSSSIRASWLRSAPDRGRGRGCRPPSWPAATRGRCWRSRRARPTGCGCRKARVEAALRRGGRQRRIAARAGQVVAALRVPQLRQDPVVEAGDAGRDARPARRARRGLRRGRRARGALVEAFRAHPDHEIITSFPGLADISGAIVLAEIGDDRNRFVDDRCLQAFAGSAPDHPGLRQVPHA